MRKQTIGVSDQVDTNRAVKSQKIDRSLKFGMKEEEGLYYPCSENKSADQLRGYREAGLRLLFSHMQIVGFLMQWHLVVYRMPLDICLASNGITLTHLCCTEITICM